MISVRMFCFENITQITQVAPSLKLLILISSSNTVIGILAGMSIWYRVHDVIYGHTSELWEWHEVIQGHTSELWECTRLYRGTPLGFENGMRLYRGTPLSFENALGYTGAYIWALRMHEVIQGHTSELWEWHEVIQGHTSELCEWHEVIQGHTFGLWK